MTGTTDPQIRWAVFAKPWARLPAVELAELTIGLGCDAVDGAGASGVCGDPGRRPDPAAPVRRLRRGRGADDPGDDVGRRPCLSAQYSRVSDGVAATARADVSLGKALLAAARAG